MLNVGDDIYLYVSFNRAIGLMRRVFISGRETGVKSQVESYQRLKKIVLDTALLNTQHYKVRIKDKVK